MKLKPSPRITPSRAVFGTQWASRLASPVAASASQMRPVARPAPATIAGVTAATPAVWVTAAAPMAFIGCTGKGVLNTSPATIRAPPNISRMPAGSILTMET